MDRIICQTVKMCLKSAFWYENMVLSLTQHEYTYRATYKLHKEYISNITLQHLERKTAVFPKSSRWLINQVCCLCSVFQSSANSESSNQSLCSAGSLSDKEVEVGWGKESIRMTNDCPLISRSFNHVCTPWFSVVVIVCVKYIVYKHACERYGTLAGCLSIYSNWGNTGIEETSSRKKCTQAQHEHVHSSQKEPWPRFHPRKRQCKVIINHAKWTL